MTDNAALKALADNGVSVWLDDLSRDRIETGNLQELIDTKGVVGVTTNPSIFQAALAKGDRYDADLRQFAADGKTVDETVFGLTTQDVRNACDILKPVFDATDGVDGRVSIEVDPRLAHETGKTVEQAKELAAARRPRQRPHQDPGHRRGPAGHLAGAGRGHQRQRHADLLARPLPRRDERLPHRSGAGPRERQGPVQDPLRRLVLRLPRRHRDRQAARRDRHRRGQGPQGQGRRRERAARLPGLRGGLRRPRAGRTSPDDGANAQRPLWASTGVKDPNYSDTLYVTELVAPQTVNTMPEKTLEAVADHGEVTGDTIAGTYEEAGGVLDALEGLGISYADVTAQLEREGVDKFEAAWGELLDEAQSDLDLARADVAEAGDK